MAIAGILCGFAAAQTPSAVPVDIQIPVAPTPFASKGKLHYVYEIHLTNFDRRGRTMTLSSVAVLSDRGKQLANLGTEDLNKSLMSPGLAEGSDVRQLGAGRRTVLFVWVSIGEAIRARLRSSIGSKSISTAWLVTTRSNAATPRFRLRVCR